MKVVLKSRADGAGVAIFAITRLTDAGCIDDRTVKVINHFSHNGEMTHDELAAWGSDRGILAACDGMEVEF